MRRLLAPMLAAAAAISSFPAGAVIIDNIEWRELTDTRNLSFNQVRTVCSETTGACSGSIGSVSFDGWRWADNYAIRELFDFVIEPEKVNFPTAFSQFLANEYHPGITKLANSFNYTGTNGYERFYTGLSRTRLSSELVYTGFFYDDPFEIGGDGAFLNQTVAPTLASQGMGVWMFRQVPEPSIVLLLGVGALGFLARRRQLS